MHVIFTSRQLSKKISLLWYSTDFFADSFLWVLKPQSSVNPHILSLNPYSNLHLWEIMMSCVSVIFLTTSWIERTIEVRILSGLLNVFSWYSSLKVISSCTTDERSASRLEAAKCCPNGQTAVLRKTLTFRSNAFWAWKQQLHHHSTIFHDSLAL